MSKQPNPAFIGRNGCLLEGGEPNPLKVWENLEQYGYDCPKSQFVMSPEQPSLFNLSKDWGVNEGALRSWKSKQRWELARRNHWGRIAEKTIEKSEEALSSLQAKEVARRISHWELQRDLLMADLRRGYIETQSSSGKINQVLISPSDRKNIAQTLELIETQLDKCLGLDKAWKQIQQAESSTSNTPLQANGIVLNLSVSNSEIAVGLGQSEPKQLGAPVEFNEFELPNLALPEPSVNTDKNRNP